MNIPTASEMAVSLIALEQRLKKLKGLVEETIEEAGGTPGLKLANEIRSILHVLDEDAERTRAKHEDLELDKFQLKTRHLSIVRLAE